MQAFCLNFQTKYTIIKVTANFAQSILYSIQRWEKYQYCQYNVTCLLTLSMLLVVVEVQAY